MKVLGKKKTSRGWSATLKNRALHYGRPEQKNGKTKAFRKLPWLRGTAVPKNREERGEPNMVPPVAKYTICAGG